MPESETCPLLCVDLDGTLVSTDTLDECLLRLVRYRPLLVLLLPLWLLRGKAYFKDRVAAAAADLLGPLPYRESVVEYIRQHANGSRSVVLATAANHRIAAKVSQDLGLFTEVLASDERLNLSGEQKLARIRALSGEAAFAYIGDHRKDVPIWLAARRAVIVGSSWRLRQRLGQVPEVVMIAPDERASIKAWIRQLRCHQWAKNLLLGVPLILAHQITNFPAVLNCLLAIIAFSLAASAVYIGNDLIDLPHDRQHGRTKKRPLASGAITIRSAAVMGLCLLAAAMGISVASLPRQFSWMLVGYVVLAAAYTLWLKRVAVLDIMLLSSFYVYRVLIGAVAIQAVISPWLPAFSMFFFLGLGMVKRLGDLVVAAKADQVGLGGRSYVIGDVEFFRSAGIASSCVAVLVLALYLQSHEVTRLYARPDVLWLVCPLVLYWNMRAWFIAQRGEMHEDPIIFALRDPVSYIVGGLTGIVLLLAVM